MQPFRFDFVRANPIAAFDAGRRNRMAEMEMGQRMEDRQIAAQQRQAQSAQVSREQMREALTSTAEAYRIAGLEQDPARRDAIIAGHRSQMERLYGPESVSDFSPRFEQAEYDALQSFMTQPEAVELPAAVRTAQWYANEATPEQRQAMTDIRRSGAQNITVGGPQPFELTNTPEGLAAVSVDPETGATNVQMVVPKETTEETEAARARARREIGEAPLADAISRYRRGIEGVSTTAGVVTNPTARRQLEQERNTLVALVAKNILGTPGAEPSPALYEKADELVPDFSGGYDRTVAGGMLDTLEGMLATRQAQDEEAATTTAVPDGPGPTRTPVPGDIANVLTDEEYEALPPGAMFRDPNGNIRRKP